MCEEGKGGPKDLTAAVKWMRKSAIQGQPLAQRYLGVMYDKGEGVEENPVLAAYWFQKSADQRDAEAQFYLATMYEDGEGVERNLKKALELYGLSAAQGIKAAKEGLNRLGSTRLSHKSQ